MTFSSARYQDSLRALRLSVYLPNRKVFHKKEGIQVVNKAFLFNMLKTMWAKFKSRVCTPVFSVEFHHFHDVFNIAISTVDFQALHFVIFKANLWQFFEVETFKFCRFRQHHFDECWFLVENSLLLSPAVYLSTILLNLSSFMHVFACFRNFFLYT